MYNSLTRYKDTYFEGFPDDLDKNRFGQCAWASFFIDNNQWFVGRWKHTWDGV